jgi:hypothetical protein
MTMKPLTDRDMETLGELIAATDSFIKLGNYRGGWVMPMDFGGGDGSHHSATAHKLWRRGLCLMKKYGGKHEKGSCRYKANAAGRRAHDEWWSQRR